MLAGKSVGHEVTKTEQKVKQVVLLTLAYIIAMHAQM